MRANYQVRRALVGSIPSPDQDGHAMNSIVNIQFSKDEKDALIPKEIAVVALEDDLSLIGSQIQVCL